MVQILAWVKKTKKLGRPLFNFKRTTEGWNNFTLQFYVTYGVTEAIGNIVF